MAWITRNHKKKERYYINNVSAEYYASKQWRALRDSYIKHNPLCERCLSNGKVTPAEHVHHIIPFLTGKEAAERWSLLLNEYNLKSLCADCHRKVHAEMRN